MTQVTVLHIFGVMNRGGAETRTVEVMRSIETDRIRLVYCVLGDRLGELTNDIRDLGGDVLACPPRLLFPIRFFNILRRERVDVVHSHVATFSGLLLTLARICRVRVRIAHFRSDSDGQESTLPRRVQRSVMTFLLKQNATSILAVTPSAMEAAYGLHWQEDPRCRVVYNGIDSSRFFDLASSELTRAQLGVQPGQFLCLHVGRSGSAKNRPRCIHLLSEMLRKGADAVLVFVGRSDADEDRMLRDLSLTLGVAERVRFAGAREDVPDLMWAADLLLLPSVREGLPGVVLEACAVGTPVLASSLPGVQVIQPHFPNVHVMPLSESDATWIECLPTLSHRPRHDQERLSSLQLLSRSPFTLDRAVTDLVSVWAGDSHG